MVVKPQVVPRFFLYIPVDSIAFTAVLKSFSHPSSILSHTSAYLRVLKVLFVVRKLERATGRTVIYLVLKGAV